MEPAAPRTIDDRARAIRRMQSVTIGTALASLAAVGVFGAVAAVSDPGNGSTAVVTSTTSGGSGPTTTTTDSSATAAPTATPTLRPASQAATSASGGGQVTTGGS